MTYCAAVSLAYSENDRLLLAQTYDGFKRHEPPQASFIYFGPEPSNCNVLLQGATAAVLQKQNSPHNYTRALVVFIQVLLLGYKELLEICYCAAKTLVRNKWKSKSLPPWFHSWPPHKYVVKKMQLKRRCPAQAMGIVSYQSHPGRPRLVYVQQVNCCLSQPEAETAVRPRCVVTVNCDFSWIYCLCIDFVAFTKTQFLIYYYVCFHWIVLFLLFVKWQMQKTWWNFASRLGPTAQSGLMFWSKDKNRSPGKS